MRNFKQYLLESETEEVAALISSKCSKWLEESGYDPKDPDRTVVRRGIKISPPFNAHYKFPVNKQRAPLSSSVLVHTALDEAFDKAFGIKFRSQAVFGCNHAGTAAGYGKVFAIFPIGDYDYTWSPNVEDAYMDSDFRVPTELKLTELDPYIEKFHKRIVNEYKFNEGIQDVIWKHNFHEIMISCDEYFAVPMPYRNDDDDVAAKKKSWPIFQAIKA